MEADVKDIIIYSDGACSGNPGPGGWGAILKYKQNKKEISGGEADTTNNRMEMMAIIKALEIVKEPCKVTLCTDSKYVIDALQKGWAVGWRAKGWIKADRKPALNKDLWEVMLNLVEAHTIEYQWVKGHNGHPENERCDVLAVEQSMKYKAMQE